MKSGVVVCCMGDCPLQPLKTAPPPFLTHFIRFASGGQNIRSSLLLVRATGSRADLCPAPLQLNRNSVGLMAFSLTDPVKKLLLSLKIGDRFCVLIVCDIKKTVLPIIKLKISISALNISHVSKLNKLSTGGEK